MYVCKSHQARQYPVLYGLIVQEAIDQIDYILVLNLKD